MYAQVEDITEERLNADKLLELETHEAEGSSTYYRRSAAALRDASSMIDAYLGGRYSLPISDEAAISFLKGLCLDLAVHKLMQRYSLPSDEIKAAATEAMEMLKAIAANKLNLPSEGGASAASGVVIIELGSDIEPTFDDLESLT